MLSPDTRKTKKMVNFATETDQLRKTVMKPIRKILFAAVAFAVSLAAQTADAQTLYLYKEFQPAKIIFRNHAVNHALMNFDTATGAMFFMDGDNVMEMTEIERVHAVEWEDHRFIAMEDHFLEEVEQPNGKVWIRWRIHDVLVGQSGAMGLPTHAKVETIHTVEMSRTEDVPIDELIRRHEVRDLRNENVYTFTHRGKNVSVRSLRELQKLYSSHKKEIAAHLADASLDPSKTSDMLLLIDFCRGFDK